MLLAHWAYEMFGLKMRRRLTFCKISWLGQRQSKPVPASRWVGELEPTLEKEPLRTAELDSVSPAPVELFPNRE